MFRRRRLIGVEGRGSSRSAPHLGAGSGRNGRRLRVTSTSTLDSLDFHFHDLTTGRISRTIMSKTSGLRVPFPS